MLETTEDIKKEEVPAEEVVDKKVLDVNLSTPSAELTTIRLNGDNSTIIKLNLYDMGIIDRLKETFIKLKNLDKKVAEINAEDISKDGEIDEDALEAATSKLNELDDDMRGYIDYLFDYPVSEVVAPKGKAKMYDIVEGEFRYEHIIDVLSNLYAVNMNKEFKKLQERTSKHTAKYTKKKRH